MSALPVVAAFIHPGTVSGDFARSLAVLSPHIAGRVLEIRSGPLISHARSFAVERFLELDEPDYLLFVDSDMVFEVEDVKCLVEHGVPVCAAMYAEQASTAAVRGDGMVWGYNVPDPNSTGLLEVERTSFGFVLIRRDVLEDMTKAYAGDRPYVYFRMDSEIDSGTPDYGEDYYFSKRARALGFACYVDCSVRVGHVKPIPYYPPPVGLGA